MLPPRWVRLLIVTPIVYIGALLGILFSPLLLVIALADDLSVSKREWRLGRITALAVAYMFREAAGLTALFFLWVAAGFGAFFSRPRFRVWHYRLLGWWTGGMSKSVQRYLGISIELETQPPRPGSVLVFSRHGGPGDSIFLVNVLIHQFHRNPRIVAKRDLQLVPFFDALGRRLPNYFIDPNPNDRTEPIARIRALVRGMGPQDALILFPEGGNVTPQRRVRAITSLRRKGLEEEAEQAERMTHLMPPRPAGALAAIDAAPDADVVFVAHTGVEHLTSLKTIWREIPVAKTIFARYWRLAPEEIPHDPSARVDWLFKWWVEIDRWIGEVRKREGVSPWPPPGYEPTHLDEFDIPGM
ncbi:MAG TPA: 1-acyl-sn-glycerol-3-phosphate acyltransferase [Acidimicrobiia bacterium]|jgi:1-acyl-sn-glycerol-3-phosphate acyltransferase